MHHPTRPGRILIAFRGFEPLWARWHQAVPNVLVLHPVHLEALVSDLSHQDIVVVRYREFPDYAEQLRAARSKPRIILFDVPEAEQLHLQALGTWIVSEPSDPGQFISRLFELSEQVPQGRLSTLTPRVVVHKTLRQLLLDGQEIPMRKREIDLLELLHESSPSPVAAQRVCTEMFGEYSPKKQAMVWQYVHGLRRKLGHYASYVDYVRGQGYRCLLRVEFLRLEHALNHSGKQSS